VAPAPVELENLRREAIKGEKTMRKSVTTLARSAALALVAALVAVSGCGTEPTKGSAGGAAGTSEKALPPYVPEVAEEKAASYTPQIDPSNFVEKIDNRYMPLTPGTTFAYEGRTADGPERVETYVSHNTREVLGVKCTVVRDKAFLDGKLSEDTFDWYAQDRDGNVWYFGEDTKEYENGKVVSTKGSWEAGVDGAKPGIVMEANPRVGDSYRQEYYEGEAEDTAEVLSLDASGLNDAVTVPYGSFGDVLKTKEWNPLEPGVLEYKYYAPGTGLIGEEQILGGTDRSELVDIKAGQ
jgi:hypothetical protein